MDNTAKQWNNNIYDKANIVFPNSMRKDDQNNVLPEVKYSDLNQRPLDQNTRYNIECFNVLYFENDAVHRQIKMT